MKVVNLVSYVADLDLVAAIRPAHRSYMATLGSLGQLAAVGPFEEGAGALFVYEVESLEAAQKIFVRDPYVTNGVVAASPDASLGAGRF